MDRELLCLQHLLEVLWGWVGMEDGPPIQETKQTQKPGTLVFQELPGELRQLLMEAWGANGAIPGIMIPSTVGREGLMRIQTKVSRLGIETAAYHLNPQRQPIMNRGQAIPIKERETEGTGLAMEPPKQVSIHTFLFTAGAIEVVREAMAPPTPTGVDHIMTCHTRTSSIIRERIHQGGGAGALCIKNE